MNLSSHCPDCFQPHFPEDSSCPDCGFMLQGAANAADLLPFFTTLDNDRYRTGRVLGKPGGFGVVYAGIQINPPVLVAIKEFFPGKSNELARAKRDNQLNVIPFDDTTAARFYKWLQRFRVEATLVKSLQHQGIVKGHAILEEKGTIYLIMDRLRGATLVEILAKRKSSLSDEEATSLLKAVLYPLKFLHEKTPGPIVHLDLNPNNLFLIDSVDPSVTPKESPTVKLGEKSYQLTLIDFGLAVNTADPQTNTDRDEVGNRAFMAPEQTKHNTSAIDYASITPAADCYSLGACLYFALTKNPPPTAEQRLKGAKLNALDKIPNSSLIELIEECLTLDPKARPQNATELQQRLDKLTSNELNAGTTVILADSQPDDISESNEPLDFLYSDNSQPDTPKLETTVNNKVKQIPPKVWPWKIAATLVLGLVATVIVINWQLFNTDTVIHNIVHKVALNYNDGTFIDTRTNLMWKRCSEGQTWSNNQCSGQATQVDWDSAMPTKQQKFWGQFAGYGDWRLPTIDELRTIVRCSDDAPSLVTQASTCINENNSSSSTSHNPTIDLKNFPGTTSGWYWSTSISNAEANNAQVIYFMDGGEYWTNRSNMGQVRLVRSK